MNTFLDRLKEAMAKSNKTKTDLWKACEISSGAVSQWFSKPTTQLRGKNLLLVARELNVRPEWLVSGEGDPKSPEINAFEDMFGASEFAIQRMLPVIKTITFKDETTKTKRSVTVNTWVGNEVTKRDLEHCVRLLYEMRKEYRPAWFQIGERLADPHGIKRKKDGPFHSKDTLVSSAPEVIDESKETLERVKK